MIRNAFKFIGFYIVKGLAYVFSIVPLPALYLLSDLLFVLNWYIVRYRKPVIIANLRYAFQELPEDEIQRIARRYYRYLGDLLMETLKLYTISHKNLLNRVVIKDMSIPDRFADRSQSIILLMGHYGNWEMLGARLSLGLTHQLCALYKPLSNVRFDKMILKTRNRFGTRMYPDKTALREIIAHRDELTGTVFLADQKPINPHAHDIIFMGRDTAAFPGAYKIARKLNLPLVYTVIKPTQRGRYEIEFKLIAEDPAETSEEEQAQKYFEFLEEDIRNAPQYWLWSHRRWKRRGDQKTDIYTQQG